MSALSRCSRFSSLLRRTNYCSRRTNVLSCSTWKTMVHDVQKPTKLLRSISHQPVLVRSNTVSAGETVQEALSSEEKKEAKYSVNFPASQFWKMFDYEKALGKDNNFHWFCQEIYSRYHRHLDVPPTTFYGCMNLVDRKTSFESEETRLLARCFGVWNNALSKDEKLEWMNYLTDRFFSLGVAVDEVYFNLILNNYLLHWIPFSPVDFLSKMEKLGVTPNGVTFERFVIAYCRNGDIKSASQVLEHMKACDYPLSNRGYASLVYGNFIAGDKETAMQLFRESDKVGFELDALSYSHVILGHAKMGDLEGVKEMVDEFQERIGPMSESILCFLLERVSETGNKQMFDYLMELLTVEPGYYYNTVANHLPTMMKQRNRDFAYQFYRGLSDPLSPLLYKSALSADIPISQVLHYASCLKADGVKHSALINYYLTAIRLKAFDKAAEILPHVAAEGSDMRPQDLWPMIRYFQILQDLDGLKTIIPYIQPESDTIGNYLNQALQSFNIDIQQYQQILKDHSKFTEGQMNACVLNYCLKTKGLDAALELAKSFKILEENAMNTRYFKEHLKKDNWESLCEVIFSTVNMLSMDLERVVKKVTSFDADMEKFKTMLLEKGVKLRESGIPKALKQMLSKEELQQITKQKMSYNEMSKLPYKQLMQYENEMGEMLIFKICLLNRAYDAKDWPMFEKTLGSMDESRILDVKIRIKLACYYASKPGMFDKCMDTLSVVKGSLKTKLSIPIYQMVTLIAHMCDNGHHAEAIQLLEDCDIGFQENLSKKLYLPRIFNMEPTEENLKQARRLLYALKDSGCLSDLADWQILQNYSKLVLKTTDTNAMFHELEMLRRDFKFNDTARLVVPFFCNVMATNDKMELQAAYDRFSQDVSEHKLLVYLAAAFLEVGHKDKARKVLATTGLRVEAKSAYGVVNMWISEDKVQLVEDFCKIAEFAPGTFTKLDAMFVQLKAMCSRPNPDVDACIHFYENKFDEEGLIPTQNQVQYFINFLKKQNRALPLNLQTLPDQMENTDTKSPTNTKAVVKESTSKQKNKAKSSATESTTEPKKNYSKTISQWQKVIAEQPDTLDEMLKSSDERTSRSKTRVLTAAVMNGDIELARKIKKTVLPEENWRTVTQVAYNLLSGKTKDTVDTWYTFVNIMDDKVTAIRSAITFTGKIANYAAMEKVYGFAKDQDLSMEKLAEKVKEEISEEFFHRFIRDIRQLEDKCKTEERPLIWEPTSTWTLQLPTIEETSQIGGQKKQTGTVSSGNRTDTNTDNVAVDNSSEVIHDTAVDISVEKDSDIGIQDTATVIKDTDSTSSNK